MTSTAIKKQVDSYLPLLTSKQQSLVLEMIKTFLNVDSDTKRITKKQYNKEINCTALENKITSKTNNKTKTTYIITNATNEKELEVDKFEHYK